MAKEAQKVGVIKGILVHQGENNSGQTDWPKRLKGVYENMLNDLGLNAEDVPLLVGEVRHSGPCSGHNDIIKNVPSVISTAHVISSDGCEAAPDQYHFSVAGYKELGKRYATKMLELLGDNPVQQSNISLSTIINQQSAPGSVEISVKYDSEVIKKVEIYADNKLISSNEASYTWFLLRKDCNGFLRSRVFFVVTIVTYRPNRVGSFCYVFPCIRGFVAGY